MKKSFLNTAVLIGIFAGLLAWYLIYEKRLRPAQETKEEQTKVLLNIERGTIQEIIVQQRQGDGKEAKYRSLKFKRTGSDWHMTAPIEDVADSGALSGLATALSSTKQDRVVDEKPADLEPYGLKTPKLKLIAKKDSSSAGEEIWIGNDTPVGSSLYVKLANKDAIYRAGQVLRTSFEKEPSEYRNKKVLNIVRNDITEMEIRTGGQTVILKHGEGDQWTLVRDSIPADTNEVNKTLNGLLDLQATGFAADKPDSASLGRFGLAPPVATVVFKKKDGQTLLLLGKGKDKFYAKRGDKDVVYEIPKDAVEKAQRPGKDYRQMKLASFNRFNIKRIKMERGKDTLELVKEGLNWKIPADAQAKLENAKVEDYLTRLQDIKVQSYLKPAERAKAHGLVVRLFEKKGDAAETEALALKLTQPAGRRSMGERTGLDLPFTLEESDFTKINASKQEFLTTEKAEEPKPGKS